MSYKDEIPFSTLTGKTILSIEGVKVGSEEVLIKCSDGEQFRMYHSQDCCEFVSIEDVIGEVDDIIGSPIVLAYESVSTDRPDDLPAPKYQPESETWTFYRIGTVKGTLVLRWLGESNGYYSESVSFEKIVEDGK